MFREFIHRLGVLLLVLSMALIFLFFTSMGTEHPVYNLLGWGILGFMLAYIIMRRTRPARQESRRFRTVRRMFAGHENDDLQDYLYDEDRDR